MTVSVTDFPKTALAICLNERSLFATSIKQNLSSEEPGITFGICLPSGCLGDQIVILKGCTFPVLLRQKKECPGVWSYVCEVFLYGYMQGEALTNPNLKEESFSIC